MLTFKPPLFPVGLVLLSFLLSGCQSLGLLSQRQPEVPEFIIPEFALDSIATHEFPLTEGQTMVGELAAIDTRESDTLPDIARHFGLGYNDITLANPGVEPWTPAPGSRVLLPLSFILPDTPQQGIVLNLANMRLFYYPSKQLDEVYTYPAGIGRQGWSTPTGTTRVIAKKANPSWYVPQSVRKEHARKGDPLPAVVKPGSDNPLGLYELKLGFPSYLIHGTNKPYGVGMPISHGCVRLYPEDIEILFNNTAVRTPVRIVHQPYLVAWRDGQLYLEANEPLPKWAGKKTTLKKKLLKNLQKISTQNNVAVDWDKVDRIIERADGIPSPILMQSPDLTELAAAAVLIKHPSRFYEQPVVAELTDQDWAALVASFDNEADAQKLAAMLNHQGPMIPARKLRKNNDYFVVIGPFKNKKELKDAAQRILIDFDITVKPFKPGVSDTELSALERLDKRI